MGTDKGRWITITLVVAVVMLGVLVIYAWVSLAQIANIVR